MAHLCNLLPDRIRMVTKWQLIGCKQLLFMLNRYIFINQYVGIIPVSFSCQKISKSSLLCQRSYVRSFAVASYIKFIIPILFLDYDKNTFI